MRNQQIDIVNRESRLLQDTLSRFGHDAYSKLEDFSTAHLYRMQVLIYCLMRRRQTRPAGWYAQQIDIRIVAVRSDIRCDDSPRLICPTQHRGTRAIAKKYTSTSIGPVKNFTEDLTTDD